MPQADVDRQRVLEALGVARAHKTEVGDGCAEGRALDWGADEKAEVGEISV